MQHPEQGSVHVVGHSRGLKIRCFSFPKAKLMSMLLQWVSALTRQSARWFNTIVVSWKAKDDDSPIMFIVN